MRNLGRIEEKEGSPVLAVRIRPVEDDYGMTVQAVPIVEGLSRFSPGEGGENVYDTLEGHTVAVRRDLFSEYENYTFFVNSSRWSLASLMRTTNGQISLLLSTCLR